MTCDLTCDLTCYFRGDFRGDFPGSDGPGELGAENSGGLGESHIGGFLQNERDAPAPSLDVLDAAQEVGDKRIAAAGYLRGFESPQGDAFHECARITDFDTVGEDGDADFIGAR